MVLRVFMKGIKKFTKNCGILNIYYIQVPPQYFFQNLIYISETLRSFFLWFCFSRGIISQTVVGNSKKIKKIKKKKIKIMCVSEFFVYRFLSIFFLRSMLTARVSVGLWIWKKKIQTKQKTKNHTNNNERKEQKKNGVYPRVRTVIFTRLYNTKHFYKNSLSGRCREIYNNFTSNAQQWIPQRRE